MDGEQMKPTYQWVIEVTAYWCPHAHHNTTLKKNRYCYRGGMNDKTAHPCNEQECPLKPQVEK
jgi:hypothetical protein